MPNIEVVLGLIGSTIGVVINVMFPSMFLVRVANKNPKEKFWARVSVPILYLYYLNNNSLCILYIFFTNFFSIIFSSYFLLEFLLWSWELWQIFTL